ncbi:MAG: MerR family transcriptional regulator [Elusimicrobiota bacterium]
MSVQEVLSCLRISSSTLREWDRKRVLPAKRNQFGWRLYAFEDVNRIKCKLNYDRPDGKKFFHAGNK